MTPGTVAHQAPLSMGFSRQEYWSGLPFPSPKDLPDPRIKPSSPALAGGFFTAEPTAVLILSVMSNSLQPYGLYPTRLLCSWDSPGKNTGLCCHALLQGIFPSQGSNPVLSHLQEDSLPSESPVKPAEPTEKPFILWFKL